MEPFALSSEDEQEELAAAHKRTASALQNVGRLIAEENRSAGALAPWELDGLASRRGHGALANQRSATVVSRALLEQLRYADFVATKPGDPQMQPNTTLRAVRGIDLLRARYAVGKHLRDNVQPDAKQIEGWVRATSDTLQRVFGEDSAAVAFSSMEGSEADEPGDVDRMRIRLDARLTMLEGLILRAEDLYAEPLASEAASKRILLIPGSDEATTQLVVDFLESIQCAPIVCGRLGEPSSAIEALDRHKDVGFAIVVLAGDGAEGGASPGLLELGFLLGKLGRGRVCVVQSAAPRAVGQDQVALRVQLDEGGEWHEGVVRALRDVGIT